jgi:hypothetical protein
MPLLPNAENAEIAIEKLRDYCLNEEHPIGKHKARVFKATFGFIQSDAEHLKQIISEKILRNEAVKKEEDHFGQRYEVDFEHQNQRYQGNITTGWIVKTQEDFPRLTTCFVNL